MEMFLSLLGNHTIAVAHVIQDVNDLVKDGHIIVDGQHVDLQFYLGGDYKVN